MLATLPAALEAPTGRPLLPGRHPDLADRLRLGVSILPGFGLGLLARAILLTWLANSTNSSLVAVIVWPDTFNYVTASMAGQGTVAIAMSVLVMVWAVAVLMLGRPTRLSNARAPRRAMTAATV